MEFTDDDMEEKEDLYNELVESLKQKITALEEQVIELHLAVYDQQDDFGVLCQGFRWSVTLQCTIPIG
jgi:hypothetical protein